MLELAKPRIRHRADGRRAVRFRFGHGFALIVLLALILRVAVVQTTRDYFPLTDAADYDRIAVSLATHDKFPVSQLALSGGPTALRAPLFPLVLGALYKVVGTSPDYIRWRDGRLMEAVLGAITVALMMLIALRLWGRPTALVSGAIAAIYPPLILVGSSLMSESLFIPLLLASVLTALVHRDSTHRWRWLVATGVLVGLAALTRGNGIALLLGVGLLVLTERPRFSLRALRAPLALAGAAVVVLVPWTVRNAHAFGEFVPITTESGYALLGSYNKYAAARTDYPAAWTPPVLEETQVSYLAHHGNEAQISDRFNTMALGYIRAHPGYLFKSAYWNGVRMFDLGGTRFELSIAKYEGYPRYLVTLSVYAFWLVALLAICGTLTVAARRAPLAFWACPLVMLLSSVFIIGSTRYRSPADPFFVVLAALAMIAGWRRLQARRHPSSPVPSAAA
jgi:4-amino-4-deoxy-L-arabinose transferase-like glycosyltransferase